MKSSNFNFKSPFFITSCALIIIIASALVSVPKENWKKFFSNKISNFATAFDISESLGVCTNGAIYTSVVENSILYYGGSFTHVGKCTGAGVPIDTSTNESLATYPKVLGSVYASVDDGSGGWYIAGNFTNVGGQTMGSVAHIFADGTLDTDFHPMMGNGVRALALSDNILYLGGDFTTIDGLSRNYIAAYDLINATTTSFNPGAGWIVMSLTVSSSTLYVGGTFHTFGGLTRERIAAYDLINATTTSFNPGTDNIVYSVMVSDSTLYVGGEFHNIGGQARNHLAAYNLLTDVVTDFNPNTSNWPYTLVATGTTLYVGGINGLNAYNILTSADETSLNPTTTGGYVYSLVISGDILYAGGTFTTFDGLSRKKLAAYDLVNATTTNLSPNVGGSSVRTLSVSESNLYVGGVFYAYDGQTRNRIAAYDLINATTTDFNPGASDYVYSLTVSDNILYVGGRFHTFGDLTRDNVAAYDIINSTTTDLIISMGEWTLPEVGPILVVNDSILYMGGDFSMVNGLTRPGLAAYDLINATTTSLNPSPNQPVASMLVSDDILYVGGWFTNFGSLTRNYIAAYDLMNATTTDFNPGAQNSVHALLVSDSTLYAGGNFTTFGGLSRNRIAAYDLINATTTSFNPSLNGGVKAFALSYPVLYLGGDFTTIDGLSRNYLAAYDLLDATTTNGFNPGASGSVETLSISNSVLYAGGYFSSFTAILGSLISFRSIEVITPGDISSTTATLRANIVSTGEETITSRGFRYGTTTEYALNITETSTEYATNKIGSLNVATVFSESGAFTTGQFDADITGLIPGTTYHYQAFITDRLGTTYTNDATFTTLALAPSPQHRSQQIINSEVSADSSTTSTSTLLAVETTSSSTEGVQEQSPVVTVSPTNNLSSDFCFKKNLSPYTSDNDVKNLQIFLNNEGFNSTEKGLETTYYGSKTISAVKAFQEYYTNEILLPFGLTEGTGNFGNTTRKKANGILGCETILEVSAPVIPKVEEPTSPEETIPEIINQEENQIPTQTQQDTESNTGQENITNQNTVFVLGESIKQSYESFINVTKDSISQISKIINTQTGSVVTKIISTTGIVAGAAVSISAIAFATPISFSEIWLIPARIFGLILEALGIRRKQRQWGTVYDSVTKRPLDPVYVSLISTETNKEIAGAITDIDGRYGFLVLPGKYKIVATKTNYIQPSKKMAGKSFDEVYNDLYFGEELIVTEGEMITKNIPMDSLSFDWNEFAKTKMNVNKFTKQKDITWAKFSKLLFTIGALISILAVVFAPQPYNYVIAGFYVLAYILNYVVLKTKKSGTLTEKNTNIPLSFAIITIFREGETSPLTKKIADKFGSYYALIPNGKYFIKVEKKNDDGTYSEVFQSSILDITKGVVNFNWSL